MKNQTIGVEIELTGITRQRAAEVVAKVVCGRIRGTMSTTLRVIENINGVERTWTIVKDTSLIAMARNKQEELVGAGYAGYTGNKDDFKVEVVTPILTYDDIPMLQAVIRGLRKAGGVSDSECGCGIHVHIGAEQHTASTLKNLVNLMHSKDALLYKALNVYEYRKDRFCRTVDTDLVCLLKKKKLHSLADVADAWYAKHIGHRSDRYHPSRYSGLNLHSFFLRGTIEFRIFNGTLHAGKIRAYIVLCLAISHQALTQRCASATPTVTDNDKYTFRCWLLRLGLIGDEFKNCREHLLKNLTGDSAHRHVA